MPPSRLFYPVHHFLVFCMSYGIATYQRLSIRHCVHLLNSSLNLTFSLTQSAKGMRNQPIEFESVLKSFTPDIPDNLSGRPRQEDAQEFLSFIMHQMHDELLKLDGHILYGNGKPPSLVSSIDNEDEDDNWETVGPRNKTAISRTRRFMPSKLSAILEVK